MGTTQTQKAREGDSTLQHDPGVIPQNDVCHINCLPCEVLSHIFRIGTAAEREGVDGTWRHNTWADIENADDKGIHGNSRGQRKGGEEEGGRKSDNGSDSDIARSSDFAPWPSFKILVSHVCRHWRIVALSTPSLWMSINIKLDDRPPYEHVSRHLERSKSLPIDIDIGCNPPDDKGDIDLASAADLEFLYHLLIPHVHRWRRIMLSERYHMEVFLDAASHQSVPAASQLKSLALYRHKHVSDIFGDAGHRILSSYFVPFGGLAPCLTHVVLWGVHVDWDQPWIASASNLIVLELAGHAPNVRPSWAQFAKILRGASALEQLSLRQSGPSQHPRTWFIKPARESPPDLNNPIQLLKLTGLTLTLLSPTRAIGLLRRIYLPGLKRLDLDFDGCYDYDVFVEKLVGPATSLSPSSTKDQPHSLLNNLDRLKITALPCSRQAVIKLYLELQSLTMLSLSMTHLPIYFSWILLMSFTRRSPGFGPIVMMPRLTTLFISGASGKNLRELVWKRREMQVPLEALFVEEGSSVESEDVDWLSKNVGRFGFFEGCDGDVNDWEVEHTDEEEDEQSDVD